jgi:predicted SprT family Zn-dependent metalloprotease
VVVQSAKQEAERMTENQYKCEECDAVFDRREDLEDHNRSIHSRYTCDICGEQLDSQPEFEAHTSVEHPEIQQPGS